MYMAVPSGSSRATLRRLYGRAMLWHMRYAGLRNYVRAYTAAQLHDMTYCAMSHVACTHTQAPYILMSVKLPFALRIFST